MDGMYTSQSRWLYYDFKFEFVQYRSIGNVAHKGFVHSLKKADNQN